MSFDRFLRRWLSWKLLNKSSPRYIGLVRSKLLRVPPLIRVGPAKTANT